MPFGMIGLGRMGGGIIRRLMRAGHPCVVYDRSSRAVQALEKAGASRFVKMIHNGIEYGLMAAYAGRFNILKNANAGKAAHEVNAETTPLRNPEHYQYDFDLADIAEPGRRGSVIPSRLLDLTAQALTSDSSLDRFGGKVADSGEGRWTIAAANDVGVPAFVLGGALVEWFASRGNDLFQNKVLSATRFGFHVERRS